jgi:ATP-dependent helicase/nuclease subunit B
MRLASTGLFSWFEKNATFVTPSPLLASVAAQQFARFQLERGIESWERPAIYSIDAWLSSCWQETRFNRPNVPTLLSRSQEHVLWHSIIEQEHPGLFDLDATVRLASRAARVLAEWHIPLDSDLWNDHTDAQQFRHWYKLFRQKCREQCWIARFDLWRLLPEWIEDRSFSTRDTVFFGFDRRSPALEALGSFAYNLEAEITREPVRSPIKCFSGFEQEIEYAARCARARFEENRSGSIGVFVPDLSMHRALVERVFEQVFYPAAFQQSARPRPVSVFRTHAAPPLQTHPLVAGALLLLELARPRIHHADAGAILRCPFITGAAAERSARALADLELRKRRELDVQLRDIESASAKCAMLVPVWAAVRRVLKSKSRIQELPVWSQFFGDLLGAAGWPGDLELDTREQEVVETWKNVLSTLASIGMVSAPVTFDVALAQLRSLLTSSGIETGDFSSPIQILDAAEAHALQFDFAVVTGLSDEAWPPRVNLSPLVPLTLLRAHKVPGSEPQSMQIERERATRSLFESAPTLQATYSGRLSPPVSKYVHQGGEELTVWPGKLPRQSYVPAALDELNDDQAPPYRGVEPARGGTSVLKAQSLCPFRAFAEFRLAAQSPEDACLGFDSRDRGGFLHKALQYVWQELKTHATLRAASADELRSLVRCAVNSAIRGDTSSAFYELTTNTERERLEELILDWLDIERQRKQAFIVEMVEQERYFEIPGLRLRMRVDRIDRLKNGNVLLIDYKSGKQTRPKLEGKRPAEPQLLVYAASIGGNVDGVFFGQLKPRELKAVGFSREKHFSGQTATVRKDWDSYIEDAQANVEEIAQEFVRGIAIVDPIKGACEFCNLKPLCRVHEKGTGGEDENDQD